MELTEWQVPLKLHLLQGVAWALVEPMLTAPLNLLASASLLVTSNAPRHRLLVGGCEAGLRMEKEGRGLGMMKAMKVMVMKVRGEGQ